MIQKVVLKKGKENFLKEKHPWIFSGAIDSFPKDFENGSLLAVTDSEGKILGHGYFNNKTSLSGRMISYGEGDPYVSLSENLKNAYTLRKSLFKDNVYRLVNGEGDFLPGLIIDAYGSYLVISIGTLGMEKLKPNILNFLINEFSPKGIYEKSLTPSRKEEGLQPQEDLLYGTIPEIVEIEEEGLRVLVSIKKGQKTGYFLDQREMRKLISSISEGKNVLNLFSYTGGFSLSAYKGGAKMVDSLDISKEALIFAKQNFELNHFDITHCRFIEEDAFAFLNNNTLSEYDIVILDPPAFAKKEKDKKAALKGYKEINRSAMSKMKKGALLLTCSCSYHIDEELFKRLLFLSALQANRNIKILQSFRKSFDHPVSLFHREGEYLKGFLLYVG